MADNMLADGLYLKAQSWPQSLQQEGTLTDPGNSLAKAFLFSLPQKVCDSDL